MRKKLLTLVLVAVMVICGLSIMTPMEVEAAVTNSGTSTVDITKTLNATGLEDTTFYFTVAEYSMSDTPASVTSIPEIDDFQITVLKNATTGTYTITLPDYEGIGIYTYEIKETAGSVAGVTKYSDSTLYLVVTVTSDGSGGLVRSAIVYLGLGGTKNEKEFANTYEAGTLTVTKEVTGNLGDTTKEFNVTVTFTKDNDTTINSSISYTVGGTDYTIAPSDWSGNTAEVTITVKDDTTVQFTNIPYGISYTVKEDDYSGDGYETTYYGTDANDGTGTMSSATESVEITNSKSSTASTGVILDNLPYILILAVVLLGVVYLIFRRRSSDMD